MAMTLRVFGKAHGGVKRRAREIEDWGYKARRRSAEGVPAWAPLALAAFGGLLLGAVLLWASETTDYRVRAILRRADLRVMDLAAD